MASIHKRETANGVRYDVRYRLPDGRGRSKSLRTKKEAEQFAATTVVDKSRGAMVDPQAGRVTLGRYADEWIDAKPDLAPRTVDAYRGLLRLHLLPDLGDVPVARIDVALVRRWRADRLRAVGAGTVAKAYRLLHAMMATAVADGLIVVNPCQIAKAGSEIHPERPTVGPGEVWGLAATVNPRWRSMVLLAGFCGLRLGEVLGLAVRHVDLLHGTLTIERQLQELGKAGTQTFTVPKSEKGKRTVVLPEVVAKDLRRHLEQMTDTSPDALLFTGAEGGPLRRYRWQQEWNKARTATGNRELRYHDLRHSALTLLAATGATVAELQAQAGHASAAAAMRYQHATKDRAVALAALVDRVIAGDEPASGGSVRAIDVR